MVKTILRNLLGNAIKFSNTNGSISISAKDQTNFIEVSVTDTGIGINKEAQEKLFNPKVYYSTLGTSKEPGTGLGLILCKEFVEINGGKLWVESDEGKGSNFKFTLPKGP